MGYKILHDRNECIGCGACVSTCENFWSLKNGKSNLKGAKKVGQNFELEVEELDCNKDAAEVCPVNCIHIIDLKTNKKII
ncbi:MAG: ferredoxin [Candidatus Aenigmatarchaeota archaeon]